MLLMLLEEGSKGVGLREHFLDPGVVCPLEVPHVLAEACTLTHTARHSLSTAGQYTGEWKHAEGRGLNKLPYGTAIAPRQRRAKIMATHRQGPDIAVHQVQSIL